MRAIGYFRVGTREDHTDEVLRARFNDYCHINLHQPIAVLEIETLNEDGSVLQPLLDRIEASGPDFLVVVGSASDLGDDLEDVVRSLTTLDRLEVQVACMDEEYPNPLQNAIHLFGFQGVSADRSSRVRESMSVGALLGRAQGRPPFGYRIGANGRLEVHRSEAQTVRMIFRMYTRYGLGLRQMVRDLNQRGLTTRSGDGWSVASVRGMLRNPAYIGTYTRFGMRRPNAHEAIVSAEDFRKAQEVARARRPFGRVNSSTPFLMSGLARCAYCGGGMMGVTRRRSWKRRDGTAASGTYRYYQCQSRNNQSRCGYHTWRESDLDEAVLTDMRAAVERGSSTGDASKLDRIRAADVANAERRLMDAVRRAAREEVTMRMLGEYLAELESARRAASSPQVDPKVALEKWAELDFSERRALVEQQVSRIVVEDDRVEVFA